MDEMGSEEETVLTEKDQKDVSEIMDLLGRSEEDDE